MSMNELRTVEIKSLYGRAMVLFEFFDQVRVLIQEYR